MDAITAEGLVKVYRTRKTEVRALDGVDLTVEEGTVLGPARPERRRQDDHRPHPRDAAQAGCRARDGGRLRRRAPGAAAPLGHRPVRPVRRGRREPHRTREPVDVRPALPAARARSRGRRADELLEQFELDRCGRPDGQDLLGRHAPPAGPRERADRAAAAAVPRRADDRPRPAQPARACGRSSAASCAKGTTLLLTTQYLEEADELADTIAVVDHGRIIARGTADELKAQVGGERIEVVVHDRAADRRRRCEILQRSLGERATVDEHTRRLTVAARRRRAAPGRGRPRASTKPASRSTTSACAARPWTTSSCR